MPTPILFQMFSIQMLYVAVREVLGDCPSQLSLVQNQPVRVLDSKREDWWLVATIPEDEDESTSAVEGWVPASSLQPDTSECLHVVRT